MENAITINVAEYNETERREFVSGWEEAGGYMGDCVDGNPTPWCAPWCYACEIVVAAGADTPSQAGAAYWQSMKLEIEAQLAEDAN